MLNSSNLVHELREEILELKKFKKMAEEATIKAGKASVEISHLKEYASDLKAELESALEYAEATADGTLIKEVFSVLRTLGETAKSVMAENTELDIGKWSPEDRRIVLHILSDLIKGHDFMSERKWYQK